MSNGKFSVAAALKDECNWEHVGGMENRDARRQIGFQMSNDFVLNHSDFILEATEVRHSRWGWNLYLKGNSHSVSWRVDHKRGNWSLGGPSQRYVWP